MILRVILMFVATLLHAAQGANGAVVKPGPETNKTSCAHGCCEANDLSTCACLGESDAPEGQPQPAAPAPARDFSSQAAASLAVVIAHLPLPAMDAGTVHPRWAHRDTTPHGPHVPLTVLHCSFLH